MLARFAAVTLALCCGFAASAQTYQFTLAGNDYDPGPNVSAQVATDTARAAHYEQAANAPPIAGLDWGGIVNDEGDPIAVWFQSGPGLPVRGFHLGIPSTFFLTWTEPLLHVLVLHDLPLTRPPPPRRVKVDPGERAAESVPML